MEGLQVDQIMQSKEEMKLLSQYFSRTVPVSIMMHYGWKKEGKEEKDAVIYLILSILLSLSPGHEILDGSGRESWAC